MSDEADLALVKRSTNGDLKAFELLVEKYQKAVFNVALRITHSHVNAEDISQAVFLKAFEKLASFNPRYKFFSWLYKIAINESLNLLHHQKRHERIEEDLVAPGKTVEEFSEDRETSERVQDALMELKVEHRVVVVLRHFHDLSYDEIGRILDIPEKKVKSRLFTARTILKDVLVKRGVRAND